MATTMERYDTSKYTADSGNGTARIFCYLITDLDELTSGKRDNPIQIALKEKGFAKKGGIYFYRFAEKNTPFLKIGSTKRNAGITNRFANGWSMTEGYTDSYVYSDKGEKKVKSEFYKKAKEISKKNPAYFVFYELDQDHSIPEADELWAMEAHDEKFPEGTSNKEKKKTVWGSKLIWHKGAFEEVLKCEFQNSVPYPRLPQSEQTAQ